MKLTGHADGGSALRIRSIAILGSLLLTGALFLLIIPATAFVSGSLVINIDKSGDATAEFQFTLQGFVENSIPQSMLETELKKGLTSSSEPPEILSFDRRGATMLLRNFAIVNDVPTGTEYVTSPMDFQKAEIALKNSALSYVVSADFSPQVMLVKFPDGFTREFIDSSTLPSLSHTIADPAKVAASGLAPAVGDLKITTSPSNARVYIDNEYAGTAPAIFSGIRPGVHEIRVEMDGFVPEVKTVNVTAGQITSLTAILSYVTQTPVQTMDFNLTESQTTPSPIIPGFGVMLACLALIGSALLYRRKR